jgi:hypothetical protein
MPSPLYPTYLEVLEEGGLVEPVYLPPGEKWATAPVFVLTPMGRTMRWFPNRFISRERPSSYTTPLDLDILSTDE